MSMLKEARAHELGLIFLDKARERGLWQGETAGLLFDLLDRLPGLPDLLECWYGHRGDDEREPKYFRVVVDAIEDLQHWNAAAANSQPPHLN